MGHFKEKTIETAEVVAKVLNEAFLAAEHSGFRTENQACIEGVAYRFAKELNMDRETFLRMCFKGTWLDGSGKYYKGE